MEFIGQELFGKFHDWEHVVRVLIRLVLAMFLGGLVGLERVQDRKPAGVRTHMLVALGAAMFTLVPLEAGMHMSDLSRVIQGVATGVGFLGAGTILQLREEHRIQGLTSAASIWVTAAAGMAVGAGWVWPALLGVVLAWVVLFCLLRLKSFVRVHDTRQGPPDEMG
jgi:putative Mg2+ transporter-C (MgtC) family protein